MIDAKKHNRAWKEAELEDVKKHFPKYNSVAIVSVENLPAGIERKYRDLLKEKESYVKVIKNRPVKNFIKKQKLPLEDKVKGTSAIILSNLNPFELYGLIKKNAGKVPAKIGSIAEEDIEVPECDTGLPAGPALSDFKALRLDTQIRAGKIYIAKPRVVVKAGEEINEKIATVLNKVGIKPNKASMNVLAVYDKKEELLYLPDVLDIDVDSYKDMLRKAYSETSALAMGIHYVAKETINKLIVKAYKESKAVAIEGEITNKETIKDLVAKASNVGNALNKKTE